MKLSRNELVLSLVVAATACGPVDPSDMEGVDTQSAIAATSLPGRIEAENYRANASGYFDTTQGNAGHAYRNDDVDIQATSDVGGGYNVGWIAEGEWLEYDTSVATAGAFQFTARVSSGLAGTKRLHLVIDGVAQPSVSFADANGWQSYFDVTLGTYSVGAGQHTVRVVAETNGFNLNRIDVARRPRWGTSATLARTGESWIQAHNRQDVALGCTAAYIYFGAGENPHWSGAAAALPSDHDIVVSTKVADLAAIRAFVDQVPRDRVGIVYMNYWQEPENDFVSAADRALYRQRASAIAPIIHAHPRMRFGVNLMQYSLKAGSGRNWRDWVVPEMDHIGWSIYADSQGDADRASNGTAAVQIVADAMAQDGRPWAAFAWGFSLNTANYTEHDRQIRVQWMRDSAQALIDGGATHAMWFDRQWNDLTYTIETDPSLLDAWTDVTSQ